MRTSLLFAAAMTWVISPALIQAGDSAPTGHNQAQAQETGQSGDADARADIRSFDDVLGGEGLSDEDFVATAAMNNLFEIRSVRIVSDRFESFEIPPYAEQLLEDHRQAGQELAAASQEAGVDSALVDWLEEQLADESETGASATGDSDAAGSGEATAGPADAPSEGGIASMMKSDHEQMLDELRQLSGAEFDQRFLEIQVQTHERAIALFEHYAEEGESDALRQVARATLPDLESHLEQARSLLDN